MYAILETISASVGISLEDINTFYVAGTFGSIIRPEAAVTIGMLPDLPLNRYVSLGNSSIGGATMALTAAGSLEEIDAIRDRITYLELNVNQEFMDTLSRKEGPLPFHQALKLFTSMWTEGVKLGVLPPKTPLEGIETDIKIAGVLNSCLKNSSQNKG